MKSANSTLAAHPDGHLAYTGFSTTSGDANQRNLRQRLERKLPPLADQLVAEELERRPDYYAARDPE